MTDSMCGATSDIKPEMVKTEYNSQQQDFKDFNNIKNEFRPPNSLACSTSSNSSGGSSTLSNPLNSPSNMAPVASTNPPNVSLLGATSHRPNNSRSPSRDLQRGVKRPNEEGHDGNPNKQSVGAFESLVNTSPQAPSSMSPHSHPNTPHGRPVTPLGGPMTPHGGGGVGGSTTPHARPNTPHGGPPTPHGPNTPNVAPSPHARPPTPQHQSLGTLNSIGPITPGMLLGAQPAPHQQGGPYTDNKMLRTLLSTEGPPVSSVGCRITTNVCYHRHYVKLTFFITMNCHFERVQLQQLLFVIAC